MAELIKSRSAPEPDFFAELLLEEDALPELQSDRHMVSEENLVVGALVRGSASNPLSDWQQRQNTSNPLSHWQQRQ